MKAYTDIEQSKILAKILPLESADMGYLWNGISSFCEYPVSNQTIFKRIENMPCWSLAALLDVLPDNVVIDGRRWSLFMNKKRISYLGHMTYDGQLHISVESDNFVNSCYEMILKLKEKNLL